MTELQILSAVKNNGGYIDFAELINHGKTDIGWEPKTDQYQIEKLIEANVLSGKPEPFTTISFGKAGLLRYKDLLLQEESNRQAQKASIEKQSRLQGELARKQAKEKTEKQRQRIFEVFLVIISSVLSNLDRIIPWIISLF